MGLSDIRVFRYEIIIALKVLITNWQKKLLVLIEKYRNLFISKTYLNLETYSLKKLPSLKYFKIQASEVLLSI